MQFVVDTFRPSTYIYCWLSPKLEKRKIAMAYAIRETSWDMTHTMDDGTEVPIKYPHIEVEYPADVNIMTGDYNHAHVRSGVLTAQAEAGVPQTEIDKYKSETDEAGYAGFDDVTNCWVFMVDDVDA